MKHSLAAFIAFAIFCVVLIPLGQFPTAHADITWSGDIDPSDPTTWNSYTNGTIGKTGSGVLDVTASSDLLSLNGYIGYNSGSTGEVTVAGTGSTWANSSSNLYVGCSGSGTLNITDGGLVSVARPLTIDYNGDDDSFINMATGGMLALNGNADDSLDDFLGLVNGTDAIRYWDDSISDWADIAGATYDDDYTLRYLTEGDLTGYTLLTVGVLEPSAVILAVMAIGTSAFLRRRRQ
jgi:T5SS/PEP-CTERM-associated repeat protein